jgi:hypothetical protein
MNRSHLSFLAMLPPYAPGKIHPNSQYVIMRATPLFMGHRGRFRQKEGLWWDVKYYKTRTLSLLLWYSNELTLRKHILGTLGSGVV